MPCEGSVSAELYCWGGGGDIPFTREIKKVIHTENGNLFDFLILILRYCFFLYEELTQFLRSPLLGRLFLLAVARGTGPIERARYFKNAIVRFPVSLRFLVLWGRPHIARGCLLERPHVVDWLGLGFVFLEKQKYSSRYIISIVVGSYHDLSCKNLQLELTRLLAMMISFQMNNEDHFVT